MAWEKKAMPKPRQTMARTARSGGQSTWDQGGGPSSSILARSMAATWCDADSTEPVSSTSTCRARSTLFWAKSHRGDSGTTQSSTRMHMGGTQPPPYIQRHPPSTPRKASPIAYPARMPRLVHTSHEAIALLGGHELRLEDGWHHEGRAHAEPLQDAPQEERPEAQGPRDDDGAEEEESVRARDRALAAVAVREGAGADGADGGGDVDHADCELLLYAREAQVLAHGEHGRGDHPLVVAREERAGRRDEHRLHHD
mmetsp:Transcript_24589/g.82538  ORF Transcript_24589/g.82538 Transcript_24589/m.82538 type:complete len:255 (+) Transcript_24589:769-1533(+)